MARYWNTDLLGQYSTYSKASYWLLAIKDKHDRSIKFLKHVDPKKQAST